MAILRYEERVRIERANGQRAYDTCVEECGCTPHEDDFYQGKTFDQVAATPLRMNAVCPHTKVIVPVSPIVNIEEAARTLTVTPKAGEYRLVDFNPCDGRGLGVLGTIAETDGAVAVKHAYSTVTHSTKVVDTVYDEPVEVNTLTFGLKDDEEVVQPVKTGEEVATEETSKVDSGDQGE